MLGEQVGRELLNASPVSGTFLQDKALPRKEDHTPSNRLWFRSSGLPSLYLVLQETGPYKQGVITSPSLSLAKIFFFFSLVFSC